MSKGRGNSICEPKLGRDERKKESQRRLEEKEADEKGRAVADISLVSVSVYTRREVSWPWSCCASTARVVSYG